MHASSLDPKDTNPAANVGVSIIFQASAVLLHHHALVVSRGIMKKRMHLA